MQFSKHNEENDYVSKRVFSDDHIMYLVPDIKLISIFMK